MASDHSFWWIAPLDISPTPNITVQVLESSLATSHRLFFSLLFSYFVQKEPLELYKYLEKETTNSNVFIQQLLWNTLKFIITSEIIILVGFSHFHYKLYLLIVPTLHLLFNSFLH